MDLSTKVMETIHEIDVTDLDAAHRDIKTRANLTRDLP